MSDSTPSRASVVAATQREMQKGISSEMAVLIGYSAATGKRLDPEVFDDAAILLRAERLLDDGMRLGEAIAEARENLVTWALPQERT